MLVALLWEVLKEEGGRGGGVKNEIPTSKPREKYICISSCAPS